MQLFDGNKDAYGTYHFGDSVRADGKVKGHGITHKSPVTPALWKNHLDGTSQLGIVPITSDSTVKFGAIDIDDYTVDVAAIILKIIENNLPLVPCRSKSGGLHLYMFLSTHIPAILMQGKLKELSAFIGYGNAEIFPKQSKLLKERGDVGQWINMPYFDAGKTDRYAYGLDGKPLGIDDFIRYAQKRRVTPDQLAEFKVVVEEQLPEGPPCLQHLLTTGFPEGTRNNGLFNLGVYAQKSNPDNWKTIIEGYNEKYLSPQLPPKEVLLVISSLTKKEYNYTCQKQPICNFCNASLCRTKKFGVGLSSGLPVMGSLTKINTEPPKWFIDVDGGGRLELETDDLQNPIRFQKKCMDILNIMPPIIKREQWTIVIGELLKNVNVIEVPKEATTTGQLMVLLEEFCTSRSQEESAEELLRGMVWLANGAYHFRLQDFLNYLIRSKFELTTRNTIANIFREARIPDKKINIGNVNGRARHVSVYVLSNIEADIEKYKLPEQNEIDHI